MGTAADQLPDMPEPYRLHRVSYDGETIILRGPYVVGRYEDDDIGLRNLVVVSLRQAGHSGKEVAACFGLSVPYVSALRGRAKRGGSVGLVRYLGRPRKLTEARARQAETWGKEGIANNEIARRLGVHPSTIGRLLKRRGRPGDEVAEAFPFALDDQAHPEATPNAGGDEASGTPAETDDEATPRRSSTTDSPVRASRLVDEDRTTRYAGAMLLHHFFSRLGIDAVLASLASRPAQRYDTASLVLAATLGFSLGTSSLEGAKHLRSKDAGALIGASSFPHLRTLRPRLKALANQCDPIAIQRVFAQAMLAADEHPPQLFYVDDHFVTYWGKRPVAKGYNIRRHLAEPGRDDTFCVDDSWRAICFSSGEPRGLSVTLPELLEELKTITAGAKVMVGFDRGGAYPKVFSALAGVGMDWITWRRAPLAEPRVAPRRSWVEVGTTRKTLLLADEVVELNGYDAGAVRQLSCYEHGRVAFQILTSNTAMNGAPLVHKLRGRWCIENTNKYLEDHHGVHWLCTYEMDEEANGAMVKNPARKEALERRANAKAAVAEAERVLGRRADERVGDVNAHLVALAAGRDEITVARDALCEASEELKGVAAKVAANELDPNATRAKPRLAARALQMVCRLLAYNAELDLARHLNAYLADDDEYRAITRNLLHLGGVVSYRRDRIVVTLDRPDAPRVAKALDELLAEIADGPPANLAGDRRPVSYQMAGS
ncbi:MAG: putative transposase [Acidimicrobiales bacterium]